VFCTTCDAPLFGEKTVVVAGGGNSALEGVIDLFPYAKKIYLMVRSEVLRGDPVTQEKVKSHPQRGDFMEYGDPGDPRRFS
jgi:thioredoxin reductase